MMNKYYTKKSAHPSAERGLEFHDFSFSPAHIEADARDLGFLAPFLPNPIVAPKRLPCHDCIGQLQGLPLRNLDEFRGADATRRIAAEQSLRLHNLTLCPLRGGLPRRRLYRSGLAAQGAVFGKASGQEQNNVTWLVTLFVTLFWAKRMR